MTRHATAALAATVARAASTVSATLALGLIALLAFAAPSQAEKAKKPAVKADPFAEYVWPSPPDKPRIKLEAVISGRADIEGESKLAKALIGASPKGPWDDFKKPQAVEFDLEGRVLVSDWASGAILRIDRVKGIWDVLGTQGAQTLQNPLGLDVGPDGTIYVADGGRHQVFAFSPEGKVKSVFGRPGELTNPTDAAVSPDGKQLFVTDAKVHKIFVFNLASGKLERSFGGPGDQPGLFGFPCALSFGQDGNLFVVDQMNSRVQILTPQGDPIDQIGKLGTSFGNLVRPKDAVVDEAGLIYIADTAFNNFQIFDADYTLLTFVGQGGEDPGRFSGLSGIAVQGDWIATVDQLGHRLQIFRYLVPKDAE